MSVHRLFLHCLTACCLLAVASRGFAQYTQAISPTNNDQSWQTGGDSWWQQGQAKCSGLGFEVTVGDWPRLYQRGYMDEITVSTFGSKEFADILQYCDLGQFRTGASAVTPTVTAENWTYRKYAAGSGSEQMDITISRLTPAVLLETANTTLDLFSGTKRIGDRWDGSAWQRDVTSTRVPSYVAYKSGGQVVVASTSSTIDLSSMDESWLLFFYGENTDFIRSRFPGLNWRTPFYQEGLKNDYWLPIDIPVLVVLQHEPTQLAPGGDHALRLTFGANGAGAVTCTPLLGNHHIEASETEAWASSFPATLANDCTTWAERLKHYPLTCTEEYEVLSGGATVNIRHTYTFQDISADDWNTTAQKILPVPPAVALSEKYGTLPLSISSTLLADDIPTHSGPYTGVDGSSTNSVTLTLTGLDTYVGEMAASPAAGAGDATTMANELETLVSETVAAGSLAPGWHWGRPMASRTELHFNNIAEMCHAFGEAWPYLSSTTRTNAYNYAVSEYTRLNPFTTGSFQKEPSGVARREYVTPVTNAFFNDVTGMNFSNFTRVDVHQQADSTYGIWALCKAANDWSLADTAWTQIKLRGDLAEADAEWASFGFFYFGEAPYVGAVSYANARFGRQVAHARIAHYKNDTTEKNKAIYRLARAAINRYAIGKLVEYFYDEDIVTVDGRSDWIMYYSLTYGEAGGGQLWDSTWTTSNDDTRTVVAWTESGPRISHMYGSPYVACGSQGEWVPSFPRVEQITPELGRFLNTHLQAECQRFSNSVATNAPNWHVNNREAFVGKENAVNSLLNSYGMFMLHAYVLGDSFTDMTARYDTAFFKYGDLYQMRRLVANLRLQGTGLSWTNAQ